MRIFVLLCLLIAGPLRLALGQDSETDLLPGWQAVLDRPGLSPEQRNGARFAGRHLPVPLFEAALPGPQQTALLRYAADHSDGSPSLVVCWEPNTPSAITKPFFEIEYAGKMVRQQRQAHRKIPIGTAFQADDTDRWSRTASNGTGQTSQGLPITLTWSIVPDGTTIPGGQVAGEGSNEPSNLRAWLAGIYGGSATGPAASQPWFPIFQAVFDNIAAQTGVRYVYEPNDDGATLSSFSSGQGVLGVRGDVRISGHALDGNSNVLAYNYFPDFSDMVLDTSDNFFNTTTSSSLRLRNVLEHEHGHGLGLSHVCPVNNTKLMEPFINLGFVGVQFDDVFTIQRLYGDFLEVHGSERDNDSFSTATPVSVPAGMPFVGQWLGIDDNTDTDHVSFSVPAGSQLTIRAVPSTASYPEGPQNAGGSCSAGTPFDSSTLQDLGLTLFGPDQSTVIASATGQPAGSIEEISNVFIATAGTYYAQVTGSGANVNQLYRLEIEVGGGSFAIQLASATIVDELLPGANRAPDPGETVRLSVILENVGQETATNLTATLTGPPGFQGFEVVQSVGDFNGGGSTNAEFTFALNGSCGDAFNLSVNLDANGENAGALPVALALGVETEFFTEDFESGNIPPGWGNAETGRGSLWSVVSSPFNPGQNSVFADDNRRAGQSILTTPSIALGAAPGTITFTHVYDSESGWDGGVLEILIGGGDWQDIVSAGGTFLAGGYNETLADSSNPIANRDAWSGDSGGFITTEVAMPPAAASQTIQLRWIFGHDNSTIADGWYIEELNLSELTCETGLPLLSLSSADDSMSEYDTASDPAVITVSAVLPVPTDLPVTLSATGSANAALDVTGFANVTLAAGSTSTSLVLTAVSDGLVEGTEVLVVTSPDATGTVPLTILDTPYGQFASTNLGITGPVNPFDDFDGDDSMNIEELVFGTDLASAASRPDFRLLAENGDYRLPAPLSSVPEGVIVEGESSTDLQTWLPDGVTILPDGFLIPGGDPERYLRLKYTIQETAP